MIDAVLERLEALILERQVDAVVHAITREDHVGTHFVEDAGQAFGERGPCEFTAGVAGLAEARDCLARQAERVDFETSLRT